jgi:phosphohistidine phosphatase
LWLDCSRDYAWQNKDLMNIFVQEPPHTWWLWLLIRLFVKQLLILRHGKAEEFASTGRDFDRALKLRGVVNAMSIGQWIARTNISVDALCCSTAQRTRQTAELVAGQCSYQGDILSSERLYLAPAIDYLSVIAESFDAEGSCLAVGHNPGVADLVSHYAKSERVFPTASLAVFELDIDSWQHLDWNTTARLRDFVLARDLES